MNIVLTVARVYSGDGIATLTKDQKELHRAKQKELFNMDKFGVVEVVDRPQSQQDLSTRWVQKQRLDASYKMRIVARGFQQTDSPDAVVFTKAPKLTTLRGLLTIAAIRAHPVAVGDCHSAFQQPPVTGESEPVQVEPVQEAQLDSSKVWLCKKALQGLKISPHAWCIHSTHKINDMSYDGLVSDPSTCVKKRTHRQDDSILLRQMDDVVGTGPNEHLMKHVEHMKTSLFFTHVVVLRNEGDTINFWSLEIAMTSRGFEVKNSTELVDSLSNIYRLESSKPTANSKQKLNIDVELATANSFGRSRLLQLSHSGWKTHLHGTMGTRHANSPFNNHPHKSSIPQQKASSQ